MTLFQNECGFETTTWFGVQLIKSSTDKKNIQLINNLISDPLFLTKEEGFEDVDCLVIRIKQCVAR